MIRAFKKYTIAVTGTAQPLIGTTLTAAILAQQSPRDLVGNSGLYTLPVTDSSMFKSKDWLNIGLLTGTGGVLDTRYLVSSVPNGTSVVIQIPNGIPAYANGTFVRLSVLVNSTYVQTIDGNAGTLYMGSNDQISTSTLAFVIAQLYPVAGGQPTEFRDGRYGLQNADDIGNYWIAGTSGDGYLPSFGEV